MRLKGKRALMVGVSTAESMGAAVARRFVEEGAQVVLGAFGQDYADSVSAATGMPALPVDITNEATLPGAIRQAAEMMGGLDVAINFAGVNRSVPIAEETFDGLMAQAKLHYVGTTLLIRYVAEAMPGSGSIMTISSVTAELTGGRLAGYAGTKAAADKVVRIAAVEYAERAIRVNSIAPGLTLTPMTGAYFDDPAVVAAFTRETPVGRMTTTADVAAAAVWLASDECIATGDTVRVSGGMHLRRLPTPRDFTV